MAPLAGILVCLSTVNKSSCWKIIGPHREMNSTIWDNLLFPTTIGLILFCRNIHYYYLVIWSILKYNISRLIDRISCWVAVVQKKLKVKLLCNRVIYAEKSTTGRKTDDLPIISRYCTGTTLVRYVFLKDGKKYNN